MCFRFRTPTHLLLALMLAAPAASLAQEVVYDSLRATQLGWWVIYELPETSSSIELPDGVENEAQAGDQITLAGTARFVTDIQVRFRGGASFTGTTSANVTLRLWESDGGLPGALLWSGVQSITMPMGSMPWVDAGFSPNTTLPDTLIWTFALDDIAASPGIVASIGAGINAAPASVGSSIDGVLWQDSSTLQWHEDVSTIGGNLINLEARFTAIPSPSAGLLALALGARASRRRR